MGQFTVVGRPVRSMSSIGQFLISPVWVGAGSGWFKPGRFKPVRFRTVWTSSSRSVSSYGRLRFGGVEPGIKDCFLGSEVALHEGGKRPLFSRVWQLGVPRLLRLGRWNYPEQVQDRGKLPTRFLTKSFISSMSVENFKSTSFVVIISRFSS